MKQIFADTFYWVALINKKDNWHQRVIEITSTLNKKVLLFYFDKVAQQLKYCRGEQVVTGVN
ncbi:hypothetical protein cce_2181 [Crocosphaera subtropica ATCC 51142]|uniref:PIN domain-containing protein n=1 Tax=Crocosphaera subtropica (strain ATCC 51142 / BH68) TaxID=43989 RepID=B1WNV2_CROS5|nr:hypothetical protein [Crocosphaera subtropica]ACB51531.1 hypothetical protein cce_2181 [Crocosphaera subtropica ATCC 51142]